MLNFADFHRSFRLVYTYFLQLRDLFEMDMYKKKVYMRLPYIYDTAFCIDFDNIKTNHVSCNMTCELKSLLKISTVLRVFICRSVCKCKSHLPQQVEAVVHYV